MAQYTTQRLGDGPERLISPVTGSSREETEGIAKKYGWDPGMVRQGIEAQQGPGGTWSKNAQGQDQYVQTRQREGWSPEKEAAAHPGGTWGTDPATGQPSYSWSQTSDNPAFGLGQQGSPQSGVSNLGQPSMMGNGQMSPSIQGAGQMPGMDQGGLPPMMGQGPLSNAYQPDQAWSAYQNPSGGSFGGYGSGGYNAQAPPGPNGQEFNWGSGWQGGQVSAQQPESPFGETRMYPFGRRE